MTGSASRWCPPPTAKHLETVRGQHDADFRAASWLELSIAVWSASGAPPTGCSFTEGLFRSAIRNYPGPCNTWGACPRNEPNPRCEGPPARTRRIGRPIYTDHARSVCGLCGTRYFSFGIMNVC